MIETRHAGRMAEERLPLCDREIIDAIAKLDGNDTTLFTVIVADSELFVGGGEGRYTVTALMNDGRSYVLVGSPQPSENTISMVIGGQRIPQPLRFIVDGLRVLKVAGHFAKAGHLDESEKWEEPS